MKTTAAPIQFPMTGEAMVRHLAKRLGVSYEDALSFMKHVAFWMDKGHSFEAAIARHMQTMRDGCALRLATLA